MTPEETMKTYRAYILGCKRKFGTARSLVHYRDYIQAYLDAKRIVLKNRPRCFGTSSNHVIGCNCKGVFECLVLTQ